MARRIETILATVLIAGALFTATTNADDSRHKDDSLAEGEIRRVDKNLGLLIVKHGPIPGLHMPPMTMAFRVKDPGMLDRVKAGDKVRFEAQKIGGQYVVVRIEAPK